MDLIYTDKNRKDLGVLLAYDLDLAFGADENNFECKVGENDHVCEPGSFLYVEGTDYGGIVDEIRRDTAAQEIVYCGRTWQGILASRIIQPDSGEDYLKLTGEANKVLASLVSRLGLGGLFSAATADTGLNIKNYQVPRYCDGYTGIVKMLESYGAKLRVRFLDGFAVLSAVWVNDYSQDADFDSDLLDFTATKSYNKPNHLICLGQGELKDRTVVHLYADANGNIGQTQTFTGLDEYAAVYDYPNAESEAELVEGGIERLEELFNRDELSVQFNGDAESYEIGDIVGALDNVTGIQIAAKIKKKIVTVQNGQTNVSYEVGGLNG